MLPAAGGPLLGKEESVTKIITCSPETFKEFCRMQEEDMPHGTSRLEGDSVRKGKVKLTTTPKDRTKARPNPKAKYKQRKKR